MPTKKRPGRVGAKQSRIEPGDQPRKRFFVSYAHGQLDDENLAQFLCHGLKHAGDEVFIDTGMKVSTKWAAEISRRIEWCDFIIVLLSANSIHSEMVQEEVRRARNLHKARGRPAFVPVLVNYTQYLGYELNAYLAGVQHLHWTNVMDSPRILSEILAAVQFEQETKASEPPEARKIVQPAGASASSHSPGLPQPMSDLRTARTPGGPVWLDDPFYIPREADAEVLERARGTGETLVIAAPRQMGKSSLLQRYLAECIRAGKRAAVVDLGILSDKDFESYGALLSGIAGELLYELGFEARETPKIQRQPQLTHCIEQKILDRTDGRIVLAFDEADRVFGQDYRQDFFTMFRAWHGRRAKLGSPWRNLDLALVISTEPYLLVDDARLSPFNVSPPIHLRPFNLEECRTLNARYKERHKLLLNDHQVKRLWQLLGGHPYLMQLAYYRLMMAKPTDFPRFVRTAAQDDGPFADHLRALLSRLQARPGQNLAQAMRQIIDHGQSPSPDPFHRLHAAGLVRRDGDRVVPANELYAQFFGRVL